MKKNKKHISSLLVLLLIFNFLIPNISLAKNSTDSSKNEKVITYDFREDFEKESGRVEVYATSTVAAGTVLVFISGYLVGKIIDGIFILATGKSIENHIVDFIKQVYRQNTYSGNTIRVKIGCGYAPGQPCLENPKYPGCGYAPGQPCN